MPRKRDRFRNLKKLLKDSKGSPTAGSDAKAFLDFLSGTTEYTINSAHKTPTGGKKRGVVALLPFNIATADIAYAAPITKWSHTKMGTGAGITGSEAGHAKYDAANAKHRTDGAYNPAIIQVKMREATWDDPSKKSQIKQKNYNRIGSRGATIPFGHKAAGDAEADRAKILIDSVKAAGGLGGTYQPEEWNYPTNLPIIENVPAMGGGNP